jgi:preprotein translocase subunit SecD
VTALGPVKDLTTANRYFVMRPVEQRSSPPCKSRPSGPSTEILVETSEGQEVACYEVGPALVAADDVSKATARPSPVGGGWEVDFTVTSEGAARFRALIQDVRSGGQVAVVVDDVLVSLARVASGSEFSEGVVAGLDEQTARHLADRLERG